MSQAKNIPTCQKYSHMPKISPGGLPVSSINSGHINIYILYTHTHIYTYEPFGLGRFATDYSTASRSRVTHDNFCKLVSISLTNVVIIHLILYFINNHNIEINLNNKCVHTTLIVIQFKSDPDKLTNKHTHTQQSRFNYIDIHFKLRILRN